jgi:hypothetical protein
VCVGLSRFSPSQALLGKAVLEALPRVTKTQRRAFGSCVSEAGFKQTQLRNELKNGKAQFVFCVRKRIWLA